MKRHECGTEHTDRLAELHCEYVAALLDTVKSYAAALDRPPTPAQVADLLAHARTIRDDSTEAARWARQVLDLGWRPAVGQR